MASNNLGGPRIADSQTAGQNRTANEALNTIDGAITASYAVGVTSSNAYELPSGVLPSYFRFVIGAGGTSPSADVTVTIPTGVAARGLTLWRNMLAYNATIEVDGQSEAPIVIAAGAWALIDIDGTDARQI